MTTCCSSSSHRVSESTNPEQKKDDSPVIRVSQEKERAFVISRLFDLFVRKVDANEDSIRVYQDLVAWINKEENEQTKLLYLQRFYQIHTEFGKKK